MAGLPPSLLLLLAIATPTLANQDDQFFQSCPPTHCGPVEIRFPLRLTTSPLFCSPAKSLSLSCSASNQTLLSLPSSPSSPFTVTAIDYSLTLLTIDTGGSLSTSCPLQNQASLNRLTAQFLSPFYADDLAYVSCTAELNSSAATPIPCLGGGAGRFGYAMLSYENIDVLPEDCVAVEASGRIPLVLNSEDEYETFDEGREISLRWSVPGISDQCVECERAGKQCGFRPARNQAFCRSFKNHGLDVKLIAGTSSAGLIILLSISAFFIYLSRKTEKEKETRMKIERFLATYTATKPTRYTYTAIKKITKRFSEKLGQGGFGSVYKGELPNGVPVAVKMLEKSKGEGEEFINEVAIIGRIHHVNVVRLLGFCSEGTCHALVYEFMPKGSLEKFIFSEEATRTHQPFSVEKLNEIAIGIARGIEYLHQGCDQRILHFDIKPHNILLDHDFNPKISDFGLAKLCSRDHSMVTMTAARGTMGYIAPEIYSRNFGGVSYKSDIYSFGMLLLEMVSGRKNVDPVLESQDEVYFPEWVYEQLVHGEDLGIAMNAKEDEIVKKLVIVALWCVQWNPMDRPCMTGAIQMLMGNLGSLQIPPKPFVSSSNQDNGIPMNDI